MIQFERNIIDRFSDHLSRIEAKKVRLDDARPLSPVILERLTDDLSLEWTHHSTSIEGNTLSLNETVIVIREGLTIGGKSLREHFEIHNHHKAIHFIEEMVEKENLITSAQVLDIHGIVMGNISDSFAGRLRNGQVRIVGADMIPPNARKVPDQLDRLLDYVNTNPYQYHPIFISAFLHYEFVRIHPFFDGNGRTARLLMNLLLMKNGYPPAIILRQDRKKYMAALRKVNHGDYYSFILLILQAAERSLILYLNALPDQDNYMPISNLVQEEEVPYGQEYISLLARRGKIDAYKEGRNWWTSKKALEKYAMDTSR